ncbi:MAG: hypothetical protein IKX00_04275 [Bacilli bacterium]|nr:hypothetical protein [Bacilli bacterium]
MAATKKTTKKPATKKVTKKAKLTNEDKRVVWLAVTVVVVMLVYLALSYFA